MRKDPYFVKEHKAQTELMQFAFSLLDKYELDMYSLSEIVVSFSFDLKSEIKKNED